MAVKVAINGFGRIGRLAFRQMFGAEGYEVVAINDLTNPKMLAHLLKYDSAQGRYALADKVEAKESSIVVDGKEIEIYAEADATKLPWGELDVDVVLECTGFYTSKDKASAHVQAGAKKVVISAPAGNDLPTIVYNVNHETLTKEDTVISAASCTTNCLAPMADALNKYAPVQSGIMLTVHAYTGDQMTLDGPQRKGDLRRARAAAAVSYTHLDYFMHEYLFNKVNIKPENINIPNGMEEDSEKECARYNQVLEDLGGVDLQLLGIGHNGHIGFNEPGEAFEKETHCVELTESTINANKRFFEKEEDVPRQAYTMGIKSIMKAKKILLIISGKEKANIVKEAFFGPVTPKVPASILQLHNDVILVADADALSEVEDLL